MQTYENKIVAATTSGRDRDSQPIHQVLVLSGSGSSALASLLYNLEEIQAAGPFLAPDHMEELQALRSAAFRMGGD